VSKWLGNLSFRDIVKVEVEKYFDSSNVEYGKFTLINSVGDVYIITVRMDGVKK